MQDNRDKTTGATNITIQYKTFVVYILPIYLLKLFILYLSILIEYSIFYYIILYIYYFMIACMYVSMNGLVPDILSFINVSNNNNCLQM